MKLSLKLTSVLLIVIVLLPGAVKGDPILTVAPAELYPAESLYIGLSNTTANSTFVLYILNQRGHPVFELENKTDANGTWADSLLIEIDETGYPLLEFGEHTVQVSVNRSMVKKKFLIVLDDNYLWDAYQAGWTEWHITALEIVDGVLMALILFFALQTVWILVLLVLILYLAFRTPKALKKFAAWIGYKIERFRLGRAYPEHRAHLERDPEDKAFYERQARKWEAMVNLNDIERTMSLLGRKLDRHEQLYEDHFKGKLTKEEFLDVLRRELEIYKESNENARLKKEDRDEIPGHTALPKTPVEAGDAGE